MEKRRREEERRWQRLNDNVALMIMHCSIAFINEDCMVKVAL